jgi:hypothetical protein
MDEKMKTLALSLILSVVAAPASACVWLKLLDTNFIAQATLVFRGEVIAYEASHGWAFVTFRVLETYRRPAQATWRLKWTSSTFGIPQTWKQSTRQFVAATTGAKDDDDELKVLQEACNEPFLLDDVADSAPLIARALDVLGTRPSSR